MAKKRKAKAPDSFPVPTDFTRVIASGSRWHKSADGKWHSVFVSISGGDKMGAGIEVYVDSSRVSLYSIIKAAR